MHFLKGLERAAKAVLPQGMRDRLRPSKYRLVMERRKPVDLVVHVGAHWGEDAGLYEEYGAETVLWIEADPETHARLAREVGERGGARHLTECALVSASEGAALSFHRFSGDGASSSVHKATDTLSERFPHVGETGEVLELQSRTLPEILRRHGIDVGASRQPMLVVDVQGHELSVLAGLGEGLREFVLCKCEVSRIPLYDGGARFEEIDAHFRRMGFALASHRYSRVPRHGDVLYVREA